MALDFPNSPTVGQLFPSPAVVNVPVYRWDGTEWVAGSGGATGTQIYISDTAPSGVPDNSLWWESDTGALYVRYNDGTSTQWVLAVPVTDPSTYAVRYDTVQTLSVAQQRQARQNISLDNGFFSVDRNGVDQTGTAGAATKIAFNHVVKDVNGWFDGVTNFRYTPQIPGNYFFELSVSAPTSSGGQTSQPSIFKNGVTNKQGFYMGVSNLAGSGCVCGLSATIAMNGTTDYIEGYIYFASGVTTVSGLATTTHMAGWRVGDL